MLFGTQVVMMELLARIAVLLTAEDVIVIVALDFIRYSKCYNAH